MHAISVCHTPIGEFRKYTDVVTILKLGTYKDGKNVGNRQDKRRDRLLTDSHVL